MKFLPLILCLLVACAEKPSGPLVVGPDGAYVRSDSKKAARTCLYKQGDLIELKLGCRAVVIKAHASGSKGPWYDVRLLDTRGSLSRPDIWEFEIKGLIKQ